MCCLPRSSTSASPVLVRVRIIGCQRNSQDTGPCLPMASSPRATGDERNSQAQPVRALRMKQIHRGISEISVTRIGDRSSIT
jgi:hypothetical protein